MAGCMERVLPKTAESITQMEKLVEIGNRLLGVARIHFRVLATSDEGDLELLVASTLPVQ